MIIIPERETVVILTPRTGSGSLKRAILERYPDALLLYRHMEADGVPIGYDRYHKVGVVRHPVDRLWSLYKFLQGFGRDHSHAAAYVEAQLRSVQRPFEDWLLRNDVVFTSPYDHSGGQRFYAHYAVRHPIPENRKSQFHYLRPDLGTEIHHYRRSVDLFEALDLSGRFCENATAQEPPPALSAAAREYVGRVFAWDFAAS